MTKNSSTKGGKSSAPAFRRGGPSSSNAASKKRAFIKARIRSLEVRIGMIEEILEISESQSDNASER